MDGKCLKACTPRCRGRLVYLPQKVDAWQNPVPGATPFRTKTDLLALTLVRSVHGGDVCRLTVCSGWRKATTCVVVFTGSDNAALWGSPVKAKTTKVFTGGSLLWAKGKSLPPLCACMFLRHVERGPVVPLVDVQPAYTDAATSMRTPFSFVRCAHFAVSDQPFQSPSIGCMPASLRNTPGA